MTKQNILGNNITVWAYKQPLAINASRTLTGSDILTESLYALSSTASAISLDLGTAATLYTAMQAVRQVSISSTINLRIFNNSVFPLTITNSTDTTNFITLGLPGIPLVIAPQSGIDLQLSLASTSPVKFFVSGIPIQLNTNLISVTGTSKTLALTDISTLQLCSNASTQTITIPPNSSVAFPLGTSIDFAQTGAGQLVFAAGAGVTILSKLSNLKISAQNAGATATKTATDTWLLVGDLAA